MTPAEQWEAVLARYEAAKRLHLVSCEAVSLAETGLYDRIRSDPNADRQALESIFATEIAVETQSAACDADEKAFRALMATPAPTVAAALRKLQIFRREAPEIEAVEEVIADLERLAR